MLDMYTDMLKNENGHLARLYIQKMTREELAEGSRKTLTWLLQDPKRTASADVAAAADVGRGGVIGLVAVAPFFQLYCRSFVKEGQPMDPSPFRAMLIEKSLDIDFRRSLAECYGHQSFYATNWEQLARDAEVLNQLAGEAGEDEEFRREAVGAIFTLVSRLYGTYRRETMKDEAPTGDGKAPRPDIVGMLAQTPCPFSPEQKVHWEALANAMQKAVLGGLKLYQEAQTERTKRSVYGFLKSAPDYHLLRDPDSLRRIAEIQAEREKAKAKDGLPAPQKSQAIPGLPK